MKTVSGKLALLAVLAIPIAIEAAQQQPRQSTQPHVQQGPTRGNASGPDDGSVVRRTITKEDELHEARGTATQPQPRRSIAPVEGAKLQNDIDAEMVDAAEAKEVGPDGLRELADAIDNVSRDLNSIPGERAVGEGDPAELYGPFDRTGDRASTL